MCALMGSFGAGALVHDAEPEKIADDASCLVW